MFVQGKFRGSLQNSVYSIMWHLDRMVTKNILPHGFLFGRRYGAVIRARKQALKHEVEGYVVSTLISLVESSAIVHQNYAHSVAKSLTSASWTLSRHGNLANKCNCAKDIEMLLTPPKPTTCTRGCGKEVTACLLCDKPLFTPVANQ